jgi:hypothetical protein
MKKNDKLIVLFGVIILVIASIGVYYWVPEEAKTTVTVQELAAISGTLSNLPRAVTASSSSPFYALISTPLAVHYDIDGNQEVLPLYIKDLSDPSSAVERAEDMIGISSDITIGNAYKKSLKEISLEVAKNFWESSEGALIIEESQCGYNLGVAAVPIASYLSIPVIVTDKVDNDVRETLESLGVTSSIVCGDIDGYGKTIKFNNADEIVNATIDIVTKKFEKVKYVTLTNPLDVTKAKVLNNVSYSFEGTVSSASITLSNLIHMIRGPKKGAPSSAKLEFSIPKDYKYARVIIDAKNLVNEDVEKTGSVMFVTLRDPDGNNIGFIVTGGGVPVRDSNGNIKEDRVHWETIIYDQPGTYTLGIAGQIVASKTTDYKVDVTVENLSSSIVPSMVGLSSVAPYLTAYHQGIIFAKPDFAFVANESIVSDPSQGVAYPVSNPGLIQDSNKHTFKIHESINKILAKLARIDLNVNDNDENLKLLRKTYDKEPVYIALVGDAVMIPQYYYYDTPDAVTLHYGWDVAGDFIYGNIDPKPRDDQVSIFAYDKFTEYPWQENIVGRITGWDVQDASALIARTIFYDNILNNMDNNDWKNTATVQTGSGTDFQRLPGFDTIRKLMGKSEELAVKWPTGEAHFENKMISNAISSGGFDVISTENLKSMRVGFSTETLNKISKLGLLNRILFPKARIKLLASEEKIKGGINQQDSNYIFSFGHGQPMGFEHADIQLEAMAFRPVILNQIVSRNFVNMPTGLSRLGEYDVRSVENMDLGPSVMMVESCYVGRIDGLYPQCCTSQAYLHAGVNTFIASSRGTPGPGYLDARAKAKGFGVREYIKTTLNPGLQKPHFSGLHAVNIFTDLTEKNDDVGTAFRNAKNNFFPMDVNSTFFWTPPLSLQIQTYGDLDLFLKNIRPTAGGDDAKCLDKKYTCLFEYNLFGDPAFNPYEPNNEGR